MSEIAFKSKLLALKYKQMSEQLDKEKITAKFDYDVERLGGGIQGMYAATYKDHVRIMYERANVFGLSISKHDFTGGQIQLPLIVKEKLHDD
jgi:hypothetical protein